MPDAEAGKIYRKQTLCWKRKKKQIQRIPLAIITHKKRHTGNKREPNKGQKDNLTERRGARDTAANQTQLVSHKGGKSDSGGDNQGRRRVEVGGSV